MTARRYCNHNKTADSVASDVPEIIDVSLINLIATPQLYDQKKVRLIGYLHLEFEGNCLYLHKDDFIHSINKNAIWINLEVNEFKEFKKLSDEYVLMEGTFVQDDNGHQGMNSGSLKNIERIQVWQ